MTAMNSFHGSSMSYGVQLKISTYAIPCLLGWIKYGPPPVMYGLSMRPMFAMKAVPELGTNPYSVFICTGTVVQVNVASFTVALVLPWPLCHSGALPHPNSLESGFQYNQWAPISVIPISPSTMRTVALTSFPAMYMFMAPLLALPKAECVSGSLIGRFFSGIVLKAIVLMQLTSTPVSYRTLTVTNSQFYN